MRHLRGESGDSQRTPKRRRINEVEGGTQFKRDKPIQEHRKPSEKSYSDANVHDHATLWQGDNYGLQVHNHFHRPGSHQDKCQILLESLTYDRMDARLRNVATAAPNTCQWLFSHERFRAWADPSQMPQHLGFLWIKGKPGSGKSTIMKETVVWTEKVWAEQVILTYFFNARSPNDLEKSSLGLYRSLLHQLLTAYPAGHASFTTRFASKERDGKVVEAWTETELQNFLVELVTNHQLPYVTVFIDALDEGFEDDMRQMVAFLEQLAQHSMSKGAVMHICLSSRHYPRISLRRGLSLVVENQAEHGQDIGIYIRSKLAGESDLQMDKVRKKVHNRSAGIFLWVVLVVSMLNKLYDQGKSPASMLRKLDDVPQDLHHMFADILSRVAEDINERVALFSTYSSADADTSIVEAGETVVRYLLDCSRGLVELTAAEPPVLQFIHVTVQDFLIGNSLAGTISHVGLPDFRADSCHIVMAKECLQYLISLGHKMPSTKSDADKHPLAAYAAEYWWQHVLASEKECKQSLLALVQDLLMNATNLLTWVRYYDVDMWLRNYNASITVRDLAPPLYYAARVGLPEVVQNLLEQSIDVNAQGGRYSNALQAASVAGYEEVVQMLLNYGADVNAEGGWCGNAIQAASEAGHKKVVQMLLNHGADVNAKGGRHGNALQVTITNGHKGVMRMLLNHGADVNAKGGEYGNAIQTASDAGHEEAVQMLLNYGADVNAEGGLYGNALQVASRNGHKKVVQMLLNHGADVNAKGGRYGNALRAASEASHEEVVKMLLNYGAEVNAQGGWCGNALQAVSWIGHENVVQILLNHGADVNAEGGCYGNALQAASWMGHKKVVKMLLNHDADVNAKGGRYGNALQAASEAGREEVVQILFNHGVDVNAKGGRYNNALQAASRNGNENVVQMLLNHGADVKIQGGCYGNALQAASWSGHKGVVQMLLNHGADVNAEGGWHDNAIQAASKAGHEEVVQMLLNHGADVNTERGLYDNALQAASRNGHEKVAQMLRNCISRT